MIGRSRAFLDAQARLARFARTDRPVLITGESGTGKELFARSLYLLSDRLDRPFHTVNCARFRDGDLLVSELFGHRKGSFTGANQHRTGIFEHADGGTIFLDEVGELSPSAQANLLRVLSEGEITPLGSNETRQVDVRVVAATNRPLEQMVDDGSFRSDLFYRLRYLRVHLPPVREREEDWKLLLRYFLRALNVQNRTHKTLTPASWALLEQYDWPGNIREIRSAVDVGYCLSDDDIDPLALEPIFDVRDRTRSSPHARDRDSHASSVIVPSSPSVDDSAHLRPRPPFWPAPASNDGASSSDDRQPASGHGLTADRCLRAMVQEGRSFWESVREPYMDRELNRTQVREVVQRGLSETDGSYKRLLKIFSVDEDDYLRFMDFLRHHRLKPDKAA